jgi:transcriptional regulator with XRE-family HTH domain
MSERSNLISRLRTNRDSRAAYIRAKLDVLIPSQLRALRLRQSMTQAVLADEAGMKQSRISAMETPGKTNFNLETLVSLAATFKVGLIVNFVPFSRMLRWENEYSQDAFDATGIDEDIEFLIPAAGFAKNTLAESSVRDTPEAAAANSRHAQVADIAIMPHREEVGAREMFLLQAQAAGGG